LTKDYLFLFLLLSLTAPKESENEIPTLIEGIEDIMGDLDTHSGAMVFTLDISYMKGSMEAI